MIAIDTNLLVHAHRRDSALHEGGAAVLRGVANSPTPWAIPMHCLVEFFGVVTHPKIWRRPSTPAEASEQIKAWLESPSLKLLYDTQATVERLMELAVAQNISGSKIHDGRIAALCLGHGVRVLWTLDRDFSRFPLTTHNPLLDA